ncbi:MAG: hypothetical protein U0802_25085 [Candidatus Binatia bacterium]
MVHRAARRLALAGLGAVALAGCPKPLPTVPALRSAAGGFQDVRTLCLLPLRAQTELPKDRLRAFEDQLAGTLQRAGYGVVTADQTMAAYKRAVQALGGLFDPHTGQRDPSRYDAVRRQALHALGGEVGCQAILAATIAVVSAPFSEGNAHWDGMSAAVGRKGTGVLGWTAALSLWVSIHNLDDQELLFNTGGIQTIADVESGFWSNEFKALPDSQLLADQAINQYAINVSLGPILRARKSDPSQAAPSPNATQ